MNNVDVGGIKEKASIQLEVASVRIESFANTLLYAIQLIRYNYDQETCDNRTGGLLTKSDWYRLCEDFEDAISQNIVPEATKIELMHAMMTVDYWKKWYKRACATDEDTSK